MIDSKYILWDFDGVLMDSMPIRNEGFASVLSHFPKDKVDLLIDYHLKNAGLSRYAKFRYFFRVIMAQEVDEVEITALAQRFSDKMLARLLDSSLLIEDSLNFVKRYHQQIPMHIVSGSDGDELRFICQHLGIDRYFRSIHGSPTPKIELVANLLKRYKYSVTETVLIGDSINDFEAAAKNELRFYGYNNPALKNTSKLYVDSFCF